MIRISLLAAAASSALLSSTAIAQVPPGNSAPVAVLPVDTIPAARDVPYPGTIRLFVDATDVDHAILKSRELIPVAGPGPVTLFLPQWMPGHHGPRMGADKMVDVHFYANGRELAWKRDPVEVFGLTIDVPAGVSEVEARFQYVTPLSGDQGRVVFTPNMVNVQWENVALYPAGYYVRQIPVSATLTVPAGWKMATALRPSGANAGSTITFNTVNYEVLEDSPVLAGRYFRSYDLGQNITLNNVADDPKDVNMPDDVLAKFRAMADQEVKVFGGTKHFDHYDFLNMISDDIGGIGLEHHRSTEISSDPGFFGDYANHELDRNVFPHEFTHSWDGKYRRGADLWTPDYRVPMRDSLLWVYEGQTQFWGTVVEARSGMSTKQEILDRLAVTASSYATLPGRKWRPLVDTTNDPIIQQRKPNPWGSEQRSEDYYNEGLLIWADVNAIIDQGTGGRKGIDDFAHAFFGMRPGDYGELTYTFDDVVNTLNQVYPYDWRTYLTKRVYEVNPEAPLGGFTKSGYALVYTDQPNKWIERLAKERKTADFADSLGFGTKSDGTLGSVRWDSIAFNAKLRGGDQILAVGDQAYSNDALKAAVTANKDGQHPIRLTVKRGKAIKTVTLNYSGGLRYPHFVKSGGPGPLDRLLTAR
ncbi:peptidase M61 [Sphingomonas sp. ASV193]|uniref:M61 family metallopeptidase n=1 Tax=Sphingomonas sp. ASV193 TaxID=3144405 RepID=UPI0032E932C0